MVKLVMYLYNKENLSFRIQITWLPILQLLGNKVQQGKFKHKQWATSWLSIGCILGLSDLKMTTGFQNTHFWGFQVENGDIY
jgi:hypothetical protein